jgi:hypothetical protein
MKLTRLALNVVGAFLILMGLIWTLQGTNSLPGSFMTGQPIWAVAGGVVAVAAVSMLAVINFRRWPQFLRPFYGDLPG